MGLYAGMFPLYRTTCCSIGRRGGGPVCRCVPTIQKEERVRVGLYAGAFPLYRTTCRVRERVGLHAGMFHYTGPHVVS